jgi:hypothetical protein
VLTMLIAHIAAALALPVTLTLSTFELIEGAAVRRINSAAAARGDGVGAPARRKAPGG